jgi:hypothetical protein
MSTDEPTNVIDAMEALSLGSLSRAELKRRVENLPKGHRRTGMVFSGENAPAGALGEPVPLQEEHEVAVNKRDAKATAEQLTGHPAVVKEKDGRCYLEVIIRGVKFGCTEISWWRCLRALMATLRKNGEVPAA